jgi:type I site-specific restriction endonuclease
MSNETDARIIIDRLLRDAEWDIEDKAQVSTEEATADGRADYVLKDSRNRPLAVIEAKRFALTRCKPRQAPSAQRNSQREGNWTRSCRRCWIARFGGSCNCFHLIKWKTE